MLENILDYVEKWAARTRARLRNPYVKLAQDRPIDRLIYVDLGGKYGVVEINETDIKWQGRTGFVGITQYDSSLPVGSFHGIPTI